MLLGIVLNDIIGGVLADCINGMVARKLKRSRLFLGNTIEKANLKSDLLKGITKRVLVADSTKYGKSQLFEVGPLKDLDLIITDKGLDPRAQAEITGAGIELILA